LRRERLHKILANRGVASRRACEDLIAAGRVSVDGNTVRELGTLVSPGADIRVDGKKVVEPAKVYYMLNKPVGYVTTLKDERGRQSVGDLLKRLRKRVYPVGRLDQDSEGLVLVTNDGDLANILTHPRFEVEKRYAVKARGRVTSEALKKLRTGVYLKGAKVSAKIKVMRKGRDTTSMLVTVTTGYNRQVRRMCAAVGHPVLKLKRVGFGPLRLKGVPRGTVRPLSAAELDALRRLARRASEKTETEDADAG